MSEAHVCVPHSLDSGPERKPSAKDVQGFLAHKNMPTPLVLPKSPRHRAAVGS
jgi:hypothetical protein